MRLYRCTITDRTRPRSRLWWLLVVLLALLWGVGGQRRDAQATAAWVWHGGNVVAGGAQTNVVPASQPAAIWLKVGYAGDVDQARIYYTTDGAEPSGRYDTVDKGFAVAMTFDHTEADPGGSAAWWQGTIPAQSQGAHVRYKIAAWRSDGGDIVYAESPTGKPLNTDEEATTFGYYVGDYATPAWVRDAVIYQVFVDRFYDGDTGNNIDCATLADGRCANDVFRWNGGDLAGIIARLDYLRDLGVNTLWISPIYENPVTQIGSQYDDLPGEIYNYHGYEAQDFLDVEDNFGANADLRTLVQAAHRAGLRLILDMVPNHSSNQHPDFQDASDRCAASPRYRWYKFGAVIEAGGGRGQLISYDDAACRPGRNLWWGDNDSYANFFGVKEMPQIDNDYGPARQATIEQALTWIDDYGFDGLRLDYAPGPSHSFWMAFRAAVKAANPDIYLVGEVWTDGGAEERKTFEGELDGVLAFDHYYLYDGFFARRTMSVDDFDRSLQHFVDFYDSQFILPSFLDNHDTDRFLWRAGQNIDRLKLALLAQMTLPQPPVIFYGAEAGLTQAQASAGKPERSRSRMLWGGYLDPAPAGWDNPQQVELHSYARTLIGLRNRYSALRTGQRVTLHRSSAAGTYAYRRSDAQGGVLAAMNNSDQERILTIPNLPGVPLGWTDGALLEDRLSGRLYVVVNGQLRLPLAAMQGAVLTLASPAQVAQAIFTVDGFVTQFGEDIFIVGSAPELGGWDPGAALPLNWLDSDTWSGSAFFSPSLGQIVEYKYIVRDGAGRIAWEPGPNRRLAIPPAGVVLPVGDAWPPP